MFDEYFADWNVRREFSKEFVSIFEGWLGAENIHRLDEVTERDWRKFNDLVDRISKRHEIYSVNLHDRTCKLVIDVNSIHPTYEEAMEKESNQFTQLVIPKLGCVLSETWDFTYIIWHKNNGAVEALAPLVAEAGLHHFHD